MYSSGEDALLGRMNESPVLNQQTGTTLVGAAPNKIFFLAAHKFEHAFMYKKHN